jgi:hypothetical protein
LSQRIAINFSFRFSDANKKGRGPKPLSPQS